MSIKTNPGNHTKTFSRHMLVLNFILINPQNIVGDEYLSNTIKNECSLRRHVSVNDQFSNNNN